MLQVNRGIAEVKADIEALSDVQSEQKAMRTLLLACAYFDWD